MEKVLTAASKVYGAALRARAAAYDHDLFRARRVSGLKVISVGGVRAGGDGKTPLALFVAQELARRGASVALVCRGYRGRWERWGGIVSDGTGHVNATVVEAGDEAMMLALRAPDIPVVVGADRVEMSKRARALGVEIVVLDSGFQHRRLARDLDIATLSLPIDAGESLLPGGRLREPLSALDRADLVGYELTTDEHLPQPLSPRSFTFRLEPESLVDQALMRCGSLEELSGVRALLVIGVARPQRFTRSVKRLGVEVVGSHLFPDHHDYTGRDLRRIESEASRLGAEIVLSTEKDIVRLGFLSQDIPLRALRVKVDIDEGRRSLDERLERFL